VIVDTNDNSLKRAEPQITRQMGFQLGGKKLTVETYAFKRYKSLADAEAGTAGCWVTKSAWDPAFAKLPFEMVGGRVRYNDN
jgi:hypothetical protein